MVLYTMYNPEKTDEIGTSNKHIFINQAKNIQRIRENTELNVIVNGDMNMSKVVCQRSDNNNHIIQVKVSDSSKTGFVELLDQMA